MLRHRGGTPSRSELSRHSPEAATTLRSQGRRRRRRREVVVAWLAACHGAKAGNDGGSLILILVNRDVGSEDVCGGGGVMLGGRIITCSHISLSASQMWPLPRTTAVHRDTQTHTSKAHLQAGACHMLSPCLLTLAMCVIAETREHGR